MCEPADLTNPLSAVRCGAQRCITQFPSAKPRITRSLSDGRAATPSFFPEAFTYVEESGPAEYTRDDGALSRCPDEPRNPAQTIYLTGRTFGISAIDQDDPQRQMIHFSIGSELLAFNRYIQRGATISKAMYRLTQDVISDDFRYQANVGASVLMSCKSGSYIDNGQLRVYRGTAQA